MTDSIEAGVWSGVEMELNGRSGNYLAAAVLGTALMGIAGEEDVYKRQLLNSATITDLSMQASSVISRFRF